MSYERPTAVIENPERKINLREYLDTESEKIEKILIPLILKETGTAKEVLAELRKDKETQNLAVFLFVAIKGNEDLKPKEILEACIIATKTIESEIPEAPQEIGKLSPIEIETLKKEIETLKKSGQTLKALNEALNQVLEKEKIRTGFEKVTLGKGIEVELSKEISKPMTYEDAKNWCEKQHGRVPSIEELQALYEKTKQDSESGRALRESFDGLVFWSSTFDSKTNSRKVFDFNDGRVEIRSDKEELHVARAVA